MIYKKKIAILKLIIKNIITISVPTFITLIYTIPDLKYCVKKALFFFNLYEIIAKYKILITIIFIVLVPFLATIFQYTTNIKKVIQTETMFTSLIAHLDTLVNLKLKILYDYFSLIKSSRKKKQIKKSFYEISNPKYHMHETIENITSCFSTIYGEPISASLLIVDDAQKIDYHIYLDGIPPENDILNESGSTARYCLETKKIVVISNTEKKNVNFVPSHIANIKSIICYPVTDGFKIAYIICVTSDKTDTFIEKDTEKYECILKQFSMRLMVDSYIYQLKEYIN